jgi:glycerol-3-phosphate acyltransferase PlsY
VIWLVVAFIVVVSYLLGAIPSGLLISKSQGIDIREHGSRNIGATNVWRTMGKKWGLLAFFCDTFKGWLAVHVGVLIAATWIATVAGPHGKVTPHPLPPDYAGIAAALGCILGHNFPIWLGFKGGKGVATSLGVIIGMMPVVSLVIFGIWGLVLKVSRYVSLASLVAALCLPITVIALMMFGPREGWFSIHGWGYFLFSIGAMAMVFKRHVANIKRLLNGAELRFGDPKPTDEPPPIPPPPAEDAPSNVPES